MLAVLHGLPASGNMRRQLYAQEIIHLVTFSPQNSIFRLRRQIQRVSCEKAVYDGGHKIFFRMKLPLASFACLMQLMLPSVYNTTAVAPILPFALFLPFAQFCGDRASRPVPPFWRCLGLLDVKGPRIIPELFPVHIHWHPEGHWAGAMWGRFATWGQFSKRLVMQCTREGMGRLCA